jgi:hypothetical protein
MFIQQENNVYEVNILFPKQEEKVLPKKWNVTGSKWHFLPKSFFFLPKVSKVFFNHVCFAGETNSS